MRKSRELCFFIGSDKALGEDGYSAMFFHNFWDEVGGNVCEMVKLIFAGSLDMGEINKTLLVLIPKIEKPEMISQFRPISLCNVIYKCVSKVVVNRLKSYLADLVSPYQTSFVPGRHIQDNVVLVKELFHIMSRLKGKKGFFAINIDLEKAYDRMDWDFLNKVLMEIELPEDFKRVMVDCCSTVSSQIIWNGSLTESFSPISPYLFILGMENLTHITSSTVQSGQWKAIKVGINGLEVSHLLFADDSMLFVEASIQQAVVMRMCLDLFCNCSG